MAFAGLFTSSDLEREVLDGFVRIQSHPDDHNLKIANYTEKAQYGKRWNNVTLNCRGLIFDQRTCEILARPFPKFFNYGEHGKPLDLDAPVEVVDKLDGSLGIMYPAPDGQYAIATRGSFTSEQAQVGTEILRTQYLPHWFDICPDCTYLFEIIYPENRIVVDYGPIRDLLFLGTVSDSSGEVLGPNCHTTFPGAAADVMPASTLREALALPPRENAEGVVVRFTRTGQQVKIKQDDYVALHKIVTGLNERAVWEHLADEKPLADLLASAPDELHPWIREVASDLFAKAEEVSGLVHAAYDETLTHLERVGARDAVGWTVEPREVRKAFALHVRQEYLGLTGYLFSLLDGKDITPAIWKAIRPAGERPYQYQREEIAA